MNTRLLTMLFVLMAFGLSAQVATVGIIGDATPTGWDADTDMTQDATDTCVWTINIDLQNGAVKFRANDAWDINWGSSDFPTGIGEPGGDNIPVFAGNYDITFNHCTGEYSLAVNSVIGIIGDATPGGWDNDTNMYQDTSEGKTSLFFINLDLANGSAKFRANDDWARNWGSADFPTGIGVQEGDNIPVSPAGTYAITLDTATGEYNFGAVVRFESIGIIGDATPGGWDNDTDMTQDPFVPEVYQDTLSLVDGSAKFRADDAWTIEWGGADFPSGIGVAGGDNIPITAGDYYITLNTESGAYNFREYFDFANVGILGVQGNVDDLAPMTSEDGNNWTARVVFGDDQVLFVGQGAAGNVTYGSGDFPSGVADAGTALIPVEAGEYIVTFSSLRGIYEFTPIVEYNAMAMTGKTGPTQAWPADDDMGANELFMTKSSEDFNMWTADEVEVYDFDSVDDGGMKFRADTAWTVNWGSADFPIGIGEKNGANIETVAGVYDVMFNSANGEYSFLPAMSTEDLISLQDVYFYPNPVNTTLNVRVKDASITGNAQATIYDMNGRVMTSEEIDFSRNNTFNTTNFNVGNYIMHITNGEYLIVKKFTVMK